ncbi:hypothetical protein BE20_12145 [Sorangium cellulosum]|nr:hypothetical protein BE20_12145 [Sorangium cellulosum]
MSIAGSTRLLGLCALALFWSAVLCVMLGCSEIADPPDARALRRQFPEQAEAILQGPFAFTLAGDSIEDLRPIEALADLSGEAALRSRFPRHGGGALRLPLPDGSEALVRELGALGEAEIAENAIAYPRRGGTSFWTALQDGYEEWLLLDASAVRRDAPVATWQIDGAELRQQGEAVELADARGAPQIHVTAPEAYAAGGRPVATRLSARGGRLELWVEAEGEAVLVDPRWKLKREMSTPRFGHTATALPDGRVLVAGGFNGGSQMLNTAEVFDPASGAWRTLRMLSAHALHTATLLSDGRVLVIGGNRDRELGSAELFDPASDTWLPLPPMHTARAAHTATLLPDGQVLVAGGLHRVDELDSAELFDPAAGTWRVLPPMHTTRSEHTATLLRDGRVFVAGGSRGNPIDSVELFDPTSGTWSLLPSMSTARTEHTATLLPDGQVLVAGGLQHGSGSLFGSAELFDPASGTWRPIDPMSTNHGGHTATLLPDGRVLIAGGLDGTGVSDSTELFDPASGTWRPFEAMLAARFSHTATLLPDGRRRIWPSRKARQQRDARFGVQPLATHRPHAHRALRP